MIFDVRRDYTQIGRTDWKQSGLGVSDAGKEYRLKWKQSAMTQIANSFYDSAKDLQTDRSLVPHSL